MMNTYLARWFSAILILNGLISLREVESVYSCYAGTIYSGSAYNTPITTVCPSSLRDACLKVYSNTGRSTSYSCAAKESCTVSVSLNGVTSSSICCYSDNCNKAQGLYSPSKFLLVSSVLIAIYSAFKN